MDVLTKITDFLLKKNWIITFLSFVVAVFISTFIPKSFYEKLPFDDTINVIVGFVCIALSVYLLLSLLVWLLHKLSCFYKKNANDSAHQKYEENLRKNQKEELRKKLWDFVNKLPPEDRQLLKEFIISNNTPIERSEHEYYYGEVRLLNSDWVISTEKEPERQERINLSDENNRPKRTMAIIQMMTTPSVRVYKIRDEIFTWLKYFYDETGKICDFE